MVLTTITGFLVRLSLGLEEASYRRLLRLCCCSAMQSSSTRAINTWSVIKNFLFGRRGVLGLELPE